MLPLLELSCLCDSGVCELWNYCMLPSPIVVRVKGAAGLDGGEGPSTSFR